MELFCGAFFLCTTISMNANAAIYSVVVIVATISAIVSVAIPKPSRSLSLRRPHHAMDLVLPSWRLAVINITTSLILFLTSHSRAPSSKLTSRVVTMMALVMEHQLLHHHPPTRWLSSLSFLASPWSYSSLVPLQVAPQSSTFSIALSSLATSKTSVSTGSSPGVLSHATSI